MEEQLICRNEQLSAPPDTLFNRPKFRFELHNYKRKVNTMSQLKFISIVTGTAVGMAVLAMANVAQAFDMGNMMKPGEWFDNDNDHHRYGRGYGGYGPYGYRGGPYGYRGGPYGYGGYPGYGGYGQQRTIVVNPSSGAEPAAPPPRLPE